VDEDVAEHHPDDEAEDYPGDESDDEPLVVDPTAETEPSPA
jgi:hypothetical protein